MSSFNYYKKAGFVNWDTHRDISNSASNIVIKSPTASMRLTVTGLTISANVAGTIAFYFGGSVQRKIAQFVSSGSSQIFPVFSNWESTGTDAPFYAVTSAAGTEGWKITAEGFELN
jgi:hypothetical protein